MANLTRAEMEDAIKGGGSVYLQASADKPARIVTSVENLPSEADLAAASGNAEAQSRAKAALDRQIAALVADRAKLDGAPVVDAPDPAPAPEAAKPPKGGK